MPKSMMLARLAGRLEIFKIFKKTKKKLKKKTKKNKTFRFQDLQTSGCPNVQMYGDTKPLFLYVQKDDNQKTLVKPYVFQSVLQKSKPHRVPSRKGNGACRTPS